MRARALCTAAAVAIAVASTVAPARADDPSSWGINGTYDTSANGEWAKVNDKYTDIPSLRAAWTISTQCISAMECSGTVTSSDGWSAPFYTVNGIWYLKRVIPAWQICPDGTIADGLETYRLYVTQAETGFVSQGAADLLTGERLIAGRSGDCGRSPVQDLRMPFRADRRT